MCQSSDLQPLTPDSELVAGGGGVENMCSPYLDSIERHRKFSFAFMFTTKARNMQDSVYIRCDGSAIAAGHIVLESALASSSIREGSSTSRLALYGEP